MPARHTAGGTNTLIDPAHTRLKPAPKNFFDKDRNLTAEHAEGAEQEEDAQKTTDPHPLHATRIHRIPPPITRSNRPHPRWRRARREKNGALIQKMLHCMDAMLHLMAATLHFMAAMEHFMAAMEHFMAATLYLVDAMLHFVDRAEHFMAAMLHLVDATEHFVDQTELHCPATEHSAQ